MSGRSIAHKTFCVCVCDAIRIIYEHYTPRAGMSVTSTSICTSSLSAFPAARLRCIRSHDSSSVSPPSSLARMASIRALQPRDPASSPPGSLVRSHVTSCRIDLTRCAADAPPPEPIINYCDMGR